MKIVVLENALTQKSRYITLRPDNAVLRNNDDFYLPSFSNKIMCSCGIVVRITRLAKCIAPKFASRCYDSVTTGVTFVAMDVMQQALNESLSCEEAYCFDRSTAIGTQWLTPEQLSGESSLVMNIGEKAFLHTDSDIIATIDQCVAEVAQKLTLKMGDLVFLSSSNFLPVKEAEKVVVSLNDTVTLDFQIK